MAALLCDARVGGPLTAGFLVLGEWPEDFESYQGRIVVIRSGAKKTRKRQRAEKKIMWKSPRGWKVLKNVHCDDVMVQYRARSDEQFRYRMFCFRVDANRDESLFVLHVTYTPEHPAKSAPPRASNTVGRFPGESTTLADDAALFFDNPFAGSKYAPGPYGGFPPTSPSASGSEAVEEAEEDDEPPRKRQKREGSPASDAPSDITDDVFVASLLSGEGPAPAPMPAALPFFQITTADYDAFMAYENQRDQFLPQGDMAELSPMGIDIFSPFALNMPMDTDLLCC
jgi:hypothetical protein